MEGRNIVVKGSRGVRGALAFLVVLTGVFALSGTAFAQEDITVIVDGQECSRDAYGGEIVCPDDQERKFDPDVDADVLDRPETPPPPSDRLPFTGADVTLFMITGAALIATGMLVVRRTRAKKSEI
jgi:LPXTG-motif cell wall-anchored protein